MSLSGINSYITEGISSIIFSLVFPITNVIPTRFLASKSCNQALSSVGYYGKPESTCYEHMHMFLGAILRNPGELFHLVSGGSGKTEGSLLFMSHK
jgi:hypothetical protein